jgi:D-alanyl-D-alanine carboxypeptidase
VKSFHKSLLLFVVLIYILLFQPFAILSLNFCGTAQALDSSTLAQKLQTAVENIRSKFNLAGVSATIIFDNETFWGTSGYSNIETLDKIEPETLFPIYSVTKTFIATIIFQLSEEGLLNLDDTIGTWLDLPEQYSTHINDKITIRQLLNHTSGIYDYSTNPLMYLSIFLYPNKEWTHEAALDFVCMPYFAPGQGWHYSSTNYILLGMIIEEATNSSVLTELHNRIFERLNLRQIFMHGEETITGEIASPYLMVWGHAINISFLYAYEYSGLVWTAGALYSTAEDMARFTSALFGGKLLSQTSLDQMLTFIPDVKIQPEIRSISSGLGIMSIEHEKFGTVWFNVGAALGQAWLVYLAELNLTCTVLINQFPGQMNDALWHPVEHLLEVVLSD